MMPRFWRSADRYGAGSSALAAPRVFAYIAFLLALSAGGRAVFGLVSARNKGQLTALAQPSRQAEDDILHEHANREGVCASFAEPLPLQMAGHGTGISR